MQLAGLYMEKCWIYLQNKYISVFPDRLLKSIRRGFPSKRNHLWNLVKGNKKRKSELHGAVLTYALMLAFITIYWTTSENASYASC